MRKYEINVIRKVKSVLRLWNKKNNLPNYDPVSTLLRLTELIKSEKNRCRIKNPDLFCEHFFERRPDCKLKQIIQLVFSNDNFKNKLVNDYLREINTTEKETNQLNFVACRFMFSVLIDLKTSFVVAQLLSQSEINGFIPSVIKWAKNSTEPLQSYATGLLAALIKIPDIVNKFREENIELVRVLFKRLKTLQISAGVLQELLDPKTESSSLREYDTNTTLSQPVEHVTNFSPTNISSEFKMEFHKKKEHEMVTAPKRTSSMSSFDNTDSDDDYTSSEEDSSDTFSSSEDSSSELSDSETDQNCKRVKVDNEGSHTSPHRRRNMESFIIRRKNMHSPNLITRQIFILCYLQSFGEYPDFLCHMFENNALELILICINAGETRLTFEALKYLSTLLRYEQFCLTFIREKYFKALFEVPERPLTATAVSICLYRLGSCEEAMKKICLLPKSIVSKLVECALFLLRSGYHSGVYYVIKFFSSTFKYRIILEQFDAQDGLKKLPSVISQLLSIDDEYDNEVRWRMNRELNRSVTKIVKHVCLALKRYLEAQLYFKVEQIRKLQMEHPDCYSETMTSLAGNKACKPSPEEVQKHVDVILQYMPYQEHWKPAEQLLRNDSIMLLLKLIMFQCELKFNFCNESAETVRHALDALAIACVIPEVQSLFCETVELYGMITNGMEIILNVAEGEIVERSNGQKSALRVIVNCVCAPINRLESRVTYSSSNFPMDSEELLQKVWKSVRSNDGIMILLQLIDVNWKLNTGADVRALACKALTGLARLASVKQILSKHEVFTSGRLQDLMRKLLPQEKLQEHSITFHKYASGLLEIVLADSMKIGNDLVLHTCHVSKPKINANKNMVIRCAKRAIGYQCNPIDKQFLYSRFCPVQTIRNTTHCRIFTCATFMPGDKNIVVGDDRGSVKLFNLQSGNEKSVFQAHANCTVHYLEPNRNGTLLLTSSSQKSMSALWGVNNWDQQLLLPYADHAEFSHVTQDRILATENQIATIYDINTGRSILRFPTSVNFPYAINRANFSYNDKLVSFDGALFDVTSGKRIHYFDKLNRKRNGVFHPNGLEIVCNSEIWDVRTFHLLKMVPVLNKCQVAFSPINNVIYATTFDEGDEFTVLGSVFITADAVNYSKIATVDLKNNIQTLSINNNDTQIATVINSYDRLSQSTVRIYEVGRKLDDEEIRQDIQ